MEWFYLVILLLSFFGEVVECLFLCILEGKGRERSERVICDGVGDLVLSLFVGF